jgi:hypothetical protein
VLQTKNEESRFLFSPLHFLTLETKKKNCVKIHLMLKSSSLERIAHYYRNSTTTTTTTTLAADPL